MLHTDPCNAASSLKPHKIIPSIIMPHAPLSPVLQWDEEHPEPEEAKVTFWV